MTFPSPGFSDDIHLSDLSTLNVDEELRSLHEAMTCHVIDMDDEYDPTAIRIDNASLILEKIEDELAAIDQDD